MDFFIFFIIAVIINIVFPRLNGLISLFRSSSRNSKVKYCSCLRRFLGLSARKCLKIVSLQPQNSQPLKNFRSLLTGIMLLLSFTSRATWVDQNTGINDDLTAARFWSAGEGVLSGKAGIYYTNGGFGPGAWTRFNITTNSSDSIIYNSCQFSGIGEAGHDQAFFCGTDTVNHRAIIFYLDIWTLTYSIRYIGTAGTSLNAVFVNGADVYAVGDNGLFVHGYLTSYSVLNSGTTSDLYSICMQAGGLAVGGDGIYLSGAIVGSVITFTGVTHPGKIFRSIVPYYPSPILIAAGAGLYKLDSSAITEVTNYDGPLNGNCIATFSNSYVVATDHGIYRGSLSTNYYEFDVGSAGMDIHSLCMLNSTEIYGVGKNGLLIKTTDGGGPFQPYAQTDVVISCKGTTSLLSGNPGSATSCKWLLNSVQISLGCAVNYTFNTAGVYTLSYVVWNAAGLYDTVTQVINVINPPLTTISTSALDTLLCKQEVIHVALGSTQNDFIYDLRKYGSTASFGQITGSSNPDTIISSLISSSGNYYVNVTSTISQCSKALTDTVKITVEKTHADFSASLVNAPVGDNVSFYERAIDANNFKWEFPLSCNTALSTDANPLGISFNSAGPTQVKLISWSDGGCYDSVTATGPYIYQPPQNDSCWAYTIDANNVAWTGFYTRDIASAAKTSKGYLVCGTGYEMQFTSRYGTTPPRTSAGGFYLASYTDDGILNWYGVSRDVDYASYNFKPVLNSVTTDSQGNIYVVGRGKGSVYYHSPNGDSVLFGSTPPAIYPYDISFIVKLDSMGNFLWRGSFGFCNPGTVKIAANGDIIVAGERPETTSYYTHNGVSYTMPAMTSANYFLMRLNPNGYAKWALPILLPHNNPVQCSDLAVDLQGNVFLTGGYEYASTFYSPDLSTSKSIPYTAGANGMDFFLAKFDTLGVPQWVSYQPSSAQMSYGLAVATDSLGAAYVTGRFENFNVPVAMKPLNSDGTQGSYVVGGYWLMKYSPSGIVQWGVGNRSSYYGWGSGVTVHNGEVSVVGSARTNNSSPCFTNFTSTNGISTPLLINQGDLFIAAYTTNGVLKQLSMTGNNAYPYDNDEKKYIFRDNSNSTYITANLASSSGIPATYFGDDVVANGLFDGVIGKMGVYGCGSTIMTGEPEKSGLQDAGVEVFPNPVAEKLYVNAPENVKIISVEIFDLPGASVYKKQTNSGSFTINRSDFTNTAGIYFLEVIDSNNHRSVHKLIIE